MSVALRPLHLAGKLIPCRWDLRPVYTMVDMDIWDEPCRAKVDEAIHDGLAVDGLTLMLFGGIFFD